MRSLLGHGNAAAPAAPPATTPRPTEAHAPASPPPSGAAPGLQAKLYETTERLALALVERAENDLANSAKGVEGPSAREIQQVLEFAMALLVKLPKLKPDDAAEDAGVDVLRLAMTDPAETAQRLQANPKFIEAMRDLGWLPPPPRPHHRPTKDQQAERQAYDKRLAEEPKAPPEDEDDSVLQGMLKGNA